jgi:callose synthase
MINREHRERQFLAAASIKFTYVVTCQIYGQQKKNKDYQAADILRLMKAYPALRIAYVDEVPQEKGVKYYSVLVKYDPKLRIEVEIYRIQLPGPLKLGEGKPENQNHALIFTRGDAVQTIDMNQVSPTPARLILRKVLLQFEIVTEFLKLETCLSTVDVESAQKLVHDQSSQPSA